jgi:hypothetical protein
MTYYGLDWIAMALTLLASYLLGNRNHWGFIVFIVANAIWTFLGFFMMNSIGMGIGNAIFLALNAIGWWKWRREAHTPLSSSDLVETKVQSSRFIRIGIEMFRTTTRHRRKP